MEPIHRSILHELGVGKRSSLSRDELRLKVGYWVDREVSDRELRGAIEWMRANDPRGAWIISDSSWSGYWLGESIEEVREHCKVTRNTAATLFKRARSQIKLAESALDEPEQMRLVI